MSAFISVRDALAVALLQIPAPAPVVLGRDLPMLQSRAAEVAVNLDGATGEQLAIAQGPTDWQTAVMVVCRARGSEALDAETAANTLLAAVYARIKATAPPAGVLAWCVAPRVRMDRDEGDTSVATATLVVDVQLRTSAGGLALAA